jgi:hypothetical protein
MTCAEFWGNFLANFTSDFLVGIALGTILAIWVGRKLSKFERSEEHKAQRRADLVKSIQYLNLLQDELEIFYERLPGVIERFSETGWGREIRIPKPFWDTLQPSGEFPQLLNPNLLATLTLLYDNLAYAKRAKDLMINCWLVPHPETVPGMDEKLQAFMAATLSGLKEANDILRAEEHGGNLPAKLDEHINALQQELEVLEAK